TRYRALNLLLDTSSNRDLKKASLRSATHSATHSATLCYTYPPLYYPYPLCYPYFRSATPTLALSLPIYYLRSASLTVNTEAIENFLKEITEDLERSQGGIKP
ncbi:hypothetical protein BC938DRAFT_483372, partial [Jimgerdemannia flammicorona]